jgi:hypothetical protein
MFLCLSACNQRGFLSSPSSYTPLMGHWYLRQDGTQMTRVHHESVQSVAGLNLSLKNVCISCIYVYLGDRALFFFNDIFMWKSKMVCSDSIS